MTWVVAAAVAWIVLAVLIGVVIGRGIRLADRKESPTADLDAASPNFVVDVDPLTAGAVPPAPRPAAEQAPNRQHGLA